MSRLAALASAGRFAELETQARNLVERNPDSGIAWKALGFALNMQQRDALDALKRASELLPQDPEAQGNLGAALLESRRFEEALSNYRRALEIWPNYVDAHNNVGNALRGLGRLEEAVASYRRAAEIRPGYAEVHHNLGNALYDLRLFDEAIASYSRALAIRPDYVEALGRLGDVLLESGHAERAILNYRRAIAIKPNLAEAHNNLGNALLDLGQLAPAIESYQRALEIRPDYLEAHSNLAIALRLQGRTAEAEVSCQRAIEINPSSTDALVVLADTQADAGQFAAAEATLRRAISLDPDCAEAWAGITKLRKMSPEDGNWLAEAQRIVARRLPLRKEILLEYAIGKYFDDVKNFDQAFGHFRQANELTKRHRIRYSPERTTQLMHRLMQLCDRTSAHQVVAEGHGVASTLPVFIVGMPRSGTSLAEQILASHPQVFGAGELMYWNGVVGTNLFGAGMEKIGGGTVRRFAEGYLELLRQQSADALRVVDKMPTNFMFLGLIYSAFPNARVIHMQRNPVDTCLSIYFQDFSALLSCANDLEDLAHYYTLYALAMRHWRTILPGKFMLDVPYEGLIEDQEAWSRRMLEFINLPWDPRCLDFHQTRRSVVTASKWQVRQRIGSGSVERWRNYAKYVGPLRNLLELPR